MQHLKNFIFWKKRNLLDHPLFKPMRTAVQTTDPHNLSASFNGNRWILIGRNLILLFLFIWKAFSAGEVSLKVSRSFLIFGTLITGPVTHYLYISLDKLFPGTGLAKSFLRVLTDRLVFSPCFLLLTLYVLSRLQGENHNAAMDTTREKYIVSLFANWKIWTLPQIININLVPPQYRVLFANIVALVWNFYLAAAKKK